MTRGIGWRERWRRRRVFLREVIIKYQQDRAPLAAAGVAYYLQLSLVPLLLLLVSISAFLVTRAQVEILLTGLTTTLGRGISHALRMEVFAVMRHRGLVTSISLLFALWTGSQVFVILEIMLNQIWHIEESRTFLVRAARAVLMVLMTGAIVVALILMMTLLHTLASLQLLPLGWQVLTSPWIATVLLGVVLPLVLVTLLFAVAYRYLPARKIPWRVVLPGATAAGTIWVIVVHFFSWYTSVFVNYSFVYGSLGGLVLLMLWFNYSVQIMLLGAEISAIIHLHRAAAGLESADWGE